MMKVNSYIEKYLDYYCDVKNATPFAVLLKGKWGCGKTHFIRKYSESKGQEKFLHISLYGLSVNKDIDEKIFEALHPVLSNPKFKLATRAISGIIRFTTKIDITGDGKGDTVVDSSGISNLDFSEFSREAENKVIIFDDIERCDIEITKLLGYINYLVEFLNQKVILIANEEKILEYKEADKYREIKEKLIGREFHINSSQKEAVNLFTEEVRDKELMKYSGNIKKILLKIFIQSKYDNLRLMQQALSHFEYFFKSFSSKAKRDEELFERMFYEFVVIFIEYKKGSIKSEDFFNGYPYFFKGSQHSKEKSHFLDKYDHGLSSWIACFSVDTLGKILQGIGLSRSEEKKLIDNLESIAGINKESWQKLWHCYDQSDEDFFKNLKDVQEKWESGAYTDFLVVLHVAGIFLGLSDDGILQKDKKEVFKKGKEYIEKLIKDKKFPLNLREQNAGFSWRESSYGLGYHGMSSREWKQLIKFIDKRFEDLKGDYVKEKIKNELMPVLRGEKNTEQGLDLLMNYNFLHINGDKEAYFQYFNVDEIMKIIVKGDRAFLSVLQKTFENRYKNMKIDIKGIEKEKPFLRKLKKRLESEIKEIERKFGNKKTPRSYILQTFLNKGIGPFM